MKILLIFPDVHSFHSIRWHPGLAYLASYLIAHEHEVEIEYINSKDDYNTLIDRVKSFLPHVVGFTAVETQFIYVREMARLIRQNHRCLIICGGAYVTLLPDCIKDERSIDGVIRGEGELALLELTDRLENNRDIRKTQNYCYFDEEKNIVIKNPLTPLLENLDELPFPEREKFNYQKDIAV